MRTGSLLLLPMAAVGLLGRLLTLWTHVGRVGSKGGGRKGVSLYILADKDAYQQRMECLAASACVYAKKIQLAVRNKGF